MKGSPGVFLSGKPSLSVPEGIEGQQWREPLGVSSLSAACVVSAHRSSSVSESDSERKRETETSEQEGTHGLDPKAHSGRAPLQSLKLFPFGTHPVELPKTLPHTAGIHPDSKAYLRVHKGPSLDEVLHSLQMVILSSLHQWSPLVFRACVNVCTCLVRQGTTRA